jgi:hypothetical protein
MATSILVPSYPFWPNDIVSDEPDSLDELAQQFAMGRDAAELDFERFLYGFVPIRAFTRILAADSDVYADMGAIGELLYAFHLSGYFGGVWLRGEIERAQPNSRLAGVALPPSEDGFRTAVERARTELAAVHAADDELLSHARASLLPSGDATALTDGLAENFGYNQGYMLEILERPPEGLAPPAEYDVRPNGPLCCSYASPKLPLLDELSSIADSLRSGRTPVYKELAEQIAPIQQAGSVKGRGVWSSGLSVQGFGERAYVQLLDVSSTYLEGVQATALATVRAIAESDMASARRAAVANAGMAVWLAAYGAGLMECRPADDVPRFGTD